MQSVNFPTPTPEAVAIVAIPSHTALLESTAKLIHTSQAACGRARGGGSDGRTARISLGLHRSLNKLHCALSRASCLRMPVSFKALHTGLQFKEVAPNLPSSAPKFSGQAFSDPSIPTWKPSEGTSLLL